MSGGGGRMSEAPGAPRYLISGLCGVIKYWIIPMIPPPPSPPASPGQIITTSVEFLQLNDCFASLSLPNRPVSELSPLFTLARHRLPGPTAGLNEQCSCFYHFGFVYVRRNPLFRFQSLSLKQLLLSSTVHIYF